MSTALWSAIRPVYRIRLQLSSLPRPLPLPRTRSFRASVVHKDSLPNDESYFSASPSIPSSNNPDSQSDEVSVEVNDTERAEEDIIQDNNGAVSETTSSNYSGSDPKTGDVDEAIDLSQPPKGGRITPSRLRSLRAQRARKRSSKPTAELELPDWFAQKCVKPWDPSVAMSPKPKGRLRDWPLDSAPLPDWYNERTLFTAEGNLRRTPESPEASAFLDLDHYLEIAAITAASFATVSSAGRNTFWGLKTNLVLQSIFEGGSVWLNSIVDQVAKDQGAGILRLDAQDISEIGGAFVSPNAKDFLSLRTLGFDAFQPSREDLEDEMEGDEGEDDHDLKSASFEPWGFGGFGTKEEQQTVKEAFLKFDERSGGAVSKSTNRSATKQITRDDSDTPSYTAIDDRRLTAFWNAVIDGARARIKTQDHRHSSEQKLMVCIQDFMEIFNTYVGEELLHSLMENVARRRGQNGEKIMIIGTTCSSEFAGDENAQKELNSENQGSLYRTVVITHDPVRKPPPVPWESWQDFWNYEKSQRTAAINLRNIQWMLKHIQPEIQGQHMSIDIDPTYFVKKSSSMDDSEEHLLFDQVLKQEDVQCLALTVIGFRELGLWNVFLTEIEGEEPPLSALIKVAIRTIQASDRKRIRNIDFAKKAQPFLTLNGTSPGPKLWDKEEKKTSGVTDEATQNANVKARLETLKATCNRHERRLIGGVVLPESIRTTFKDIHVAPDTVNAVRMLTSLPLSRPDAFKYGVLATDSISGLLLYGPPGTGKTLLAKAVAKESGSTVLTITGAETQQMYMGESEKIIKAIFTLARKLAPCVVFIDEADSMLGARTSGGSNTNKHHADALNQLLLEWDGLGSVGVFLMVATNRPFDLDDAVLRRLPRRVLVDLPVKEDREAILGIHLRNEQLDPSVSIPSLAEQTPFYSGSDLKNVAVSAALACIKEEFEAKQAAEAKGEEFLYAEKRTLSQRHFQIALEEVTASISADMASLKHVKKFDEEFGAGKGKKRRSGFGFLDQEKKEEDARVRG